MRRGQQKICHVMLRSGRSRRKLPWRAPAWSASMMLVLLLTASASGQVQVARQHPRLFLKADGVAAIKQKCAAVPEVQRAYQRMRQFAFSDAMQTNLWVAPDELSAILVAYVVEDRDPRLLARARRYLDAFRRNEGDSWTRPRMLKALSHAYDWLYGDLPAEDRRECAKRIAELGEMLFKQYRHSDYNNHVYLERGPLVYAGLALAGDGLVDDFAASALKEGESLLKEHFVPTFNQVGAQGQGGWHESMSYFSFFAYEFAHQLEAWRSATGEDLFPSCPGLRGAPLWLVYCTQPHDRSFASVADINTPVPWGWQESAYLALLASRYRDGLAQYAALQVPPEHAPRAWPFVLWFDPAIRPAAAEELPKATLFPGIGWAAMRSSWQRDACWSLFICGDYYAGHQHADQNSFIIARQGNLAIDAGEYGAKDTSFHNTILVGERQRPYGNDPRQFYAATEKGSEFDTGEILAFEENEFFTYVVGDASNAYGDFRGGKRLRAAPHFMRRYVFLKPSTFVIEDQVRVSDNSGPVCWLLHTHDKPVVEGRTIRVTHDEGELVCERLLPNNADVRVVSDCGGQKKLPHHRIEVVALDRGAVRFLHVVHARRRGDVQSAASAQLDRADGHLQLQVTAEGRVFRLTLPEGWPSAADIAIRGTDGANLLDRRPLPSGI
jgi:hypothetical protein